MIGAIFPLIILFATIYLLLRKIGDTTHVDLNTLRGDEWYDIGIFPPSNRLVRKSQKAIRSSARIRP